MSPFPSYDFSLGMVLKPRKRCFNSWTSDGTTQMKRVQINSLFVFSYLPCPKHQALLPPFSITILGHLFKHKQQICLLVPMTLGCTLPCKPAQWMLMIQISTIKIVRPSGFSCHGLPECSEQHLLSWQQQHCSQGLLPHSIPKPKHFPWPWQGSVCQPAQPQGKWNQILALLQSEKEVSGVVLCFILCWQGTQAVYSCLLRNSTDCSPC